MIYDLKFCYRIEPGAGWGTDENGKPCTVYCEVKLGECEAETRDAESEKQAHEDVQTVSKIIGVPAEYITPITQEEYDANAGEGGGNRWDY